MFWLCKYNVALRRVGLERTGLLGMFLLVSCSSLALLSVFLPGSPMDLTVIWQDSTNSSLASSPPPPWTLSEVASGPFWLHYCSVLVFLAGTILARYRQRSRTF